MKQTRLSLVNLSYKWTTSDAGDVYLNRYIEIGFQEGRRVEQIDVGDTKTNRQLGSEIQGTHQDH